jgi:hypothetical protein
VTPVADDWSDEEDPELGVIWALEDDRREKRPLCRSRRRDFTNVNLLPASAMSVHTCSAALAVAVRNTRPVGSPDAVAVDEVDDAGTVMNAAAMNAATTREDGV